MDTVSVTQKTKQMIDDLKTVCSNFGLGNASSEYKIITELFLYKFINDKFLYEVKKVDANLEKEDNVEKALESLPDVKYEMLLARLPASTALLKKEHLISYLFNRKESDKFSELFDNTLVDIANFNIDVFSVKAGSEDKIRLFDPISINVIEVGRRDEFCKAMINKLAIFSFNDVFNQKYDFFATIFEYLIKDYNKDFGKYAEYYTPHSIATIIAKCLVPEGDANVNVYDPAAGSGTLVLAVAHQIGENNCSIYTQDISQKSNEFLRLNLILNNLAHSLDNVIHGDTLLNPRHLNRNKTGLATFDYVVSNPPFNVDFSDNRDELAGEKHKERFWAGVPSIPPTKPDKMKIYLMFIQHILYSLKDGKGKAAIVVPTGFVTAQNGIEKTIRKKLIDEKWLKGCISMPSNIFANTGTNVSVLFIDKSNNANDVILIDASKLGIKVKDGKNQRTVLNEKEIEKIEETFINKDVIDDFSVKATYDQIKEKNYSFSAGQYFDVKIEFVELTQDEFEEKIDYYKKSLNELFAEGKNLEEEFKKKLEELKYE